MLKNETITFLNDLKKHNNKEWMDAHRAAYLTAKKDFENLVSNIIEGLSAQDELMALLQPSACIFRINRDIRFSKDKSPYKTNFGAVFKSGGKKDIKAGFYLHIEPEKSFLGGGVWMPDPLSLKNIRQEIDYNYDEFKKIIEQKKFKQTYSKIEGESLARPPKGYLEDNPAIQYLKLKSFTVGCPINNEALTQKNLTKKILDGFEIMQPFMNFLNVAIEG